MSEFREFVDDMFYANIGAAATLKDKVSEKLDEYIEKGKSIGKKTTDMNDELKYNKEKANGKDVVSILDDLTSEEKRALKEALLNEQE